MKSLTEMSSVLKETPPETPLKEQKLNKTRL